MGNLSKWVIIFVSISLAVSTEGWRKLKRSQDQSVRATEEQYDEDPGELEPCQCGVFMSLQVGVREGRRGRPRGPPTGEPVVTYDTDEPSLPCSSGHKHCISKCLDVILKYLPKAGPVICGAVERDVHREKAFLFIKNCGDEWIPTHFSAGKEFCCKDGQHMKC
ncbi:PREDICTED: follicle cell protein 3C-1 [Papilio polytes]|uniref:follicle cell protein 3C-1 n=1 Tax=Papilio polytes TaxID=76194 RepID=UPI00067606EB|nr:PREDICTED: follicle cell protein 3C-1 [Papilio polytes]